MNAVVDVLMLEIIEEDDHQFDYLDIELLKKVLEELKDNYTKNFYAAPDTYRKNINFINTILLKTYSSEQRKFLYQRYQAYKNKIDPNY